MLTKYCVVFLAGDQKKNKSSRHSHDVSGVGLATQPDIPLHRAETQEGLLVPAKGVDEAEGRDREVTMGK